MGSSMAEGKGFMRLASGISFLAVLLFFSVVSPAFAVESYESVYSEYPTDKFIVGIGETFMTDNSLMDKRVSEIRARLSIVRQVNLRLSEETIETMCEGGARRLFKDWLECRNEFKGAIDKMVEGFKEAATIVDHGRKSGVVYAVAVLPRLKAVRDINISLKESLENTIVAVERAARGDLRYYWKAREEYIKALTYAREKEIIGGGGGYDRDLFMKLEEEILELRKAF
jgi:hypothetical protein